MGAKTFFSAAARRLLRLLPGRQGADAGLGEPGLQDRRDGGAGKANPRLVRRAGLWCAATLLVCCAVSAAASLAIGYERAVDIQDDLLEEVVGLLSRDVIGQKYRFRIRELTLGGFYGEGSKLAESIEASDRAALTMDDDRFEDGFLLDEKDPRAVVHAGDAVLVRLLHKKGRAAEVRLAQDFRDGAHTVDIFGEPHRIYLRTLADGTHVAAGQKLKERNEAVWVSALASAAPILILVPVLLAVLLAVLWRALQPLKKLEAQINARAGDDLAPLALDGIPAEVVSTVASVNRLLGRVDELKKRQARFVSDAAHELRTPISVLQLQVDRLRDMELNEAARSKVAELAAGIERTGHLVAQLLVLQRAQFEKQSHPAGGPPECDVKDVVVAVVEDLFWVAQAKDVALQVAGLDDGPQGQGLRAAVSGADLATLVRNFADNAVKYTPEGGTVTISVGTAAGGIGLRVADTGPGIAPELRGRVFDPFYRVLGNQAVGTGLGLAICKTVADKNGISIALDWADAKAQQGLAVEVVLPRAA